MSTRWNWSESTFRGFPALPRDEFGVLVDKCLSKRIVVGMNRFKGFRAVALDEVFSNHSRTEDEQFLGAAGEYGWSVFTQNDKMIRNPVQMALIQSEGAKVFTLTNSHLGADGGGLVFGRWLVTIRRRIAEPGPCFWRLYEDRKTHDIK